MMILKQIKLKSVEYKIMDFIISFKIIIIITLLKYGHYGAKLLSINNLPCISGISNYSRYDQNYEKS